MSGTELEIAGSGLLALIGLGFLIGWILRRLDD